jgi:hypothetical protein
MIGQDVANAISMYITQARAFHGIDVPSAAPTTEEDKKPNALLNNSKRLQICESCWSYQSGCWRYNNSSRSDGGDPITFANPVADASMIFSNSSTEALSNAVIPIAETSSVVFFQEIQKHFRTHISFFDRVSHVIILRLNFREFSDDAIVMSLICILPF